MHLFRISKAVMLNNREYPKIEKPETLKVSGFFDKKLLPFTK
jgi:hypothetical protein